MLKLASIDIDQTIINIIMALITFSFHQINNHFEDYSQKIRIGYLIPIFNIK